MRIVILAIGLFLGFSGVTTLLNPRPLLVGHPSPSRFLYRGGGVVESVSAEGSIVYGACATALGIAMIYSVFVCDRRVGRSDRSIAHGILAALPELKKRYGRIEDCSRAQIETTCKELKIEREIVPYLLAAFMGREELRKLETLEPGTDWKEVEDRVNSICLELPHEGLSSGHFHESWSGIDGA